MNEGLSLPIDLDRLQEWLLNSALAEHAEVIVAATQAVLAERRHGDVPRWLEGLERLPEPSSLSDLTIELDANVVAAKFTPINQDEPLADTLKRMSPWRKGPFQFGDVAIDTEWRSDWKWQRIEHELSSLQGRTVLDVGCGNGYHLWRLKAKGAQTVLGIDPSPLFVIQFLAMQKFVQDPSVNLLPLAMEQFTAPNAFDTVLSMGVLSHRRDPMAHLHQLLQCLKPGGELLLETLVLPGESNTALRIDGRYARMRNVWELPTSARVVQWLDEAGFQSVRLAMAENTSTDEQRTTEWMPYESLQEALDESNPELTIEGHPRPCRAVFVASAPSGAVSRLDAGSTTAS